MWLNMDYWPLILYDISMTNTSEFLTKSSESLISAAAKTAFQPTSRSVVGDAEHAAAVGENTIAVAPRAGVEDLDVALASRGGGETADLGAAQGVVGIAPRRHHDADRPPVVPAQIELVQVALAGRQ